MSTLPLPDPEAGAVAPRAVALAVGIGELLHGQGAPGQVAKRARGEAPNTLVSLDGGAGVALDAALEDWRGQGLRAVQLAVPAPADPVGLAGPAPFNAAALEAGIAVLLRLRDSTVGLTPRHDARTLVWQVHPAEWPPYADPAEAGRLLRQGLVAATRRLVDLDVATWQPEIPDLLLDMHRPAPRRLPGHWDARRAETFDRALLCRQIVSLASADEGGAVSSYEMVQRSACLRDLDALARRALAACCSDSLDLP